MKVRRIVLALLFVGVLAVGAKVVDAQMQCPGCFDDCCPDFIPYGLCWPIGWWPC